jgi:HEAT repeat protein
MRRFVSLLQSDPDAAVRAAAAAALGRFVLLGELEDLDHDIAKEAEEALLQTYRQSDEPVEVHRRILESLGFSSRKEVTPLIKAASQHESLKMQASALLAMGRNGDSRWTPVIGKALRHTEPEICFEATRAAGEIGLVKAVPRLIQLAHSRDREIKEMAIWSLGEIGGSEAQQALFELADSETSPDLAEAIEDALNMAALSLGDFGLVVLPADDDDEDFEGLEVIDEEQDAL